MINLDFILTEILKKGCEVEGRVNFISSDIDEASSTVRL